MSTTLIKHERADLEVCPLPEFVDTFEEFMNMLDEDISAEWVDGKVVLLSPASKDHQSIVCFLISLLNVFVEERDLGAVLVEPFQMRLRERLSRQPDIIFIARDNLERLKGTYLDGPADLAIEVISPESRTRDRVEKLHEYAAAGVREYWLIDPIEHRADFHVLGDDGEYRRLRPRSGRVESRLLTGLWLEIDWLWPPRPRILKVLSAWGIIRSE